VQERFVPERVAATLLPLLEAESPARSAALAGLAEVRARLGTPGASRRVAEMIAQLLVA
jgi:lipid-A-disaccharide synthase